MEWTKLQPHPAADKFPRMVASELESLANSIRLNGQLFPVMLTADGLILDGRNRLAAYSLAMMEGLEPWIETYSGSLTPNDYVRSVNWERMHLNPSQRASLAVLMLPKAKEEAKQRQGKRTDLTSASVDAEVKNGKATAIVSDLMKVSPAQVERAAAIQKKNPEAFERIKEGKSTVRAEHAKLPPTDKKAAKKAADDTFTAALDKVFTALNSFNSGLQQLNLDLHDIPKLEEAERSKYLESALRLQKQLNTLIRKLQGD